MPCNSCSKPFNLLRKEKGCPNCGFSYCYNCLNNKVFVKKLNSEAKVCLKCKQSTDCKKTNSVDAPDAYYKRIANMKVGNDAPLCSSNVKNETDLEIQQRLQKLKDEKVAQVKYSTDDIAKRLDKIKGEPSNVTDAELHLRLANLRGVPISVVPSKPSLPAPDLRTEQEQADDLLKQYMAQTKIDDKYETDFNAVVGDIESRLQNLKGQGTSGIGVDTSKKVIAVPHAVPHTAESDDDEQMARKIIKRITSMPADEDNISGNDELPFCEICNEDAQVRCVGCKYLFCKRCYLEHKDDDDGCNSYTEYKPQKA